MNDEFGYDAGALSRITASLRTATHQLDSATELKVSVVDAGFSSNIANEALARVQKAGVVLAQVIEDIAGKVDSADGSYADIENTAEGELRWHESRLPGYDGGPLERAPSRPN